MTQKCLPYPVIDCRTREKINTNLFQPSVAFYIETSHLFCKAKQMTGFYMKRNTGMKWVKIMSHLQDKIFCEKNVCKQTFQISYVRISQKVKGVLM